MTARYPRVVREAAELFESDRHCTCCKKRLSRKFAYLELDQRIDAYHDFGAVPAEKSQGWFPFGLGCAQKLNDLAAHIRDTQVAV